MSHDKHHASHLERLQEQVVDAMLREPPARVERAHPTPSNPGVIATVAALALAVVAMLVVLPWLQRPESPQIGGVGAGSPRVAEVPPWDAKQLREQAMLAAELEELFPGRWQWQAETDHTSKLEIGDRDRPSAKHSPLAIQLTVMKRTIGEKNWSPVWQASCVSREQELIQLDSPTSEGGSLLLWTYAVEKDLVAVDCHFKLGQSDELETNYSVIQPEGVPTQGSSMRHGDAEYAVFQTVTTLDLDASL